MTKPNFTESRLPARKTTSMCMESEQMFVLILIQSSTFSSIYCIITCAFILWKTVPATCVCGMKDFRATKFLHVKTHFCIISDILSLLLKYVSTSITYKNISVRFEVITLVKSWTVVFRVVMLSSLVGGYQCSSKMIVSTCNTMWCHKLEDHSPHSMVWFCKCLFLLFQEITAMHGDIQGMWHPASQVNNNLA
jgi:hypothetical protein